VRDFESDFRSPYERIRRLYKAPGHVQVLCVRSKVSLRVERGYLNSGNEWKALRAMVCERDGNYLASPKFYSKRRTCQVKTMRGPVYLVNMPKGTAIPVSFDVQSSSLRFQSEILGAARPKPR
jgi:hypothetical protein